MNYIRGYNSFVKQQRKEINKNALIIEKQLIREFSSRFWELCLTSKVFTVEEKSWIKSELSHHKVDLLKEEWEFFNKAVDFIKDKGGKFADWAKGKIKQLKEGIGSFVKGIIEMAKKLLTSFIDHAKKLGTKLFGKGGDKLKDKVEDLDKNKVKIEIQQLTETWKFWGPSKPGQDVSTEQTKAFTTLKTKIESTEEVAVSSSKKNLDEIKLEESLLSDISTDDDILWTFYKLQMVNEAEEASDEKKEEEKSKTPLQKAISWILGFLRQENVDPEAKTGRKILWWGKLILKILGFCINPIFKLAEGFMVAEASKGLLKLWSKLTQFLGGPGYYAFDILSDLAATVLELITDTLLLKGVEFPGSETLTEIKEWISELIAEFADEFCPGFPSLKLILKGFTAAMIIWHVLDKLQLATKTFDLVKKAKAEVKSETEKPGQPSKTDQKEDTEPKTEMQVKPA